MVYLIKKLFYLEDSLQFLYKPSTMVLSSKELEFDFKISITFRFFEFLTTNQ